jgi:ATP-binding protein involved in chromosome partitioning
MKCIYFFQTLRVYSTSANARSTVPFRPVLRSIPNVSHAIIVASGKGGVGKSTVAANLAIALSLQGKRVGLLDADVYGPSIPKLMNLKSMDQEMVNGEHVPRVDSDGRFIPEENYNISCMSIGMILPRPESAVVWRGLMVTKALQQLLFQTSWPVLDYLVIDTPPGTGDTHLTISQNVVIDGAIIVSTGQDLALQITKKGIDMLRMVKVPIIGWIKNMAWYECDRCQHRHILFGNQPSKYEISEYPLLGDFPMIPEASQSSDLGLPIMMTRKDSVPLTRLRDMYLESARKIIAKIEE